MVNEPTTTSTSHSGAKVRGSAVVTDDVGTASNSPMLDATLAIAPLDAAHALWAAIDFTPPDSQLPYVSGFIEDAGSLFTRLVAVDEGRFAFDAPDGDFLVCLLDGTGPYVLTGCGVATVAGATEWTVSRGEGGFEVSASG